MGGDSERYAIYKGSQSSHCCFEATVVDTTKPVIISGEHYKDSSGQLQYEAVCECFTVPDAEMICKAMNASKPAVVESEDTTPTPSSFTYYVMSDGELMGFNECPEDAFDDEEDQVFRRVSCCDVMALHKNYGRRIDEVVLMFPEISNPKIVDGYRVKAEVTVGWLRAINVLSGYLQQEYRVRNPEFRGKFTNAD